LSLNKYIEDLWFYRKALARSKQSCN